MWIFGWQKNGWKKKTGENGNTEDVLNRDLFEKLLEVSKNKKVVWKKIPGHSGIEANERCDEIATSFADNNSVKLFSGKAGYYKINLEFVDGDIKDPKTKSKDLVRTKGKAYSYISRLDGKVFVDKTWEECKKRVSGVSGAKYKKSLSQEDEDIIVGEFKFLK
jgi:ribonuclease HI